MCSQFSEIECFFSGERNERVDADKQPLPVEQWRAQPKNTTGGQRGEEGNNVPPYNNIIFDK